MREKCCSLNAKLRYSELGPLLWRIIYSVKKWEWRCFVGMIEVGDKVAINEEWNFDFGGLWVKNYETEENREKEMYSRCLQCLHVEHIYHFITSPPYHFIFLFLFLFLDNTNLSSNHIYIILFLHTTNFFCFNYIYIYILFLYLTNYCFWDWELGVRTSLKYIFYPNFF